ncbi:MAG: MATE family efflux transporter [Oscillospiraceae bacterium]
MILSYLLQQVYSISDAAIVGQTLTAQEVAGVNDTTSLVFIFLQFAFGVSAGFCVVTSRQVGPGTRRGAPVPGHPDRPVGGADGAADGPGPGAAEPHAWPDQRDPGQCRGVSGGPYLLLHHLRGHRGPAVL